MLEPFTALSLAASIVALVDFGGKLVYTSYKIHQSTQGTTEGNIRLGQVTNDLLLVSQRLDDSLDPTKAPSRAMTTDCKRWGRGARGWRRSCSRCSMV